VLTAAGLSPDPWQAQVIRTGWQRVLLLCSRQVGKSQTAAALALLTVLREPGALVLLLSPSLRQSLELFRQVAGPWRGGGAAAAGEAGPRERDAAGAGQRQPHRVAARHRGHGAQLLRGAAAGHRRGGARHR